MKRTKRTLLICLILILGLCCIGADALEQTIRVRLPVDVNTGELKANSFAYREGKFALHLSGQAVPYEEG